MPKRTKLKKDVSGYTITVYGNEVEVRKENSREIKLARNIFTEDDPQDVYASIRNIDDIRSFVQEAPPSSRYWTLK